MGKEKEPIVKRGRANTGDVEASKHDAVSEDQEAEINVGDDKKPRFTLGQRINSLRASTDALCGQVDSISRYQMTAAVKIYAINQKLTGKEFAELMHREMKSTKDDARIVQFSIMSRSEALVKCRTDLDLEPVLEALKLSLPDTVRAARADAYSVNSLKRVPMTIFSMLRKKLSEEEMQNVRSYLPRTAAQPEYCLSYVVGDKVQCFVRSHVQQNKMEICVAESFRFSPNFTLRAEDIIQLFEEQPYLLTTSYFRPYFTTISKPDDNRLQMIGKGKGKGKDATSTTTASSSAAASSRGKSSASGNGVGDNMEDDEAG